MRESARPAGNSHSCLSPSEAEKQWGNPQHQEKTSDKFELVVENSLRSIESIREHWFYFGEGDICLLKQ